MLYHLIWLLYSTETLQAVPGEIWRSQVQMCPKAIQQVEKLLLPSLIALLWFTRSTLAGPLQVGFRVSCRCKDYSLVLARRKNSGGCALWSCTFICCPCSEGLKVEEWKWNHEFCLEVLEIEIGSVTSSSNASAQDTACKAIKNQSIYYACREFLGYMPTLLGFLLVYISNLLCNQ